ncbi:Heme O synthase, protoheme IX farnesyltransferase COX10-CtaB [Methylophaga thiooxydans]|uniref:Protoheme IX farnesyltransferase n=1 Tax=Methylophaga thiooxydans TaxID=392484 RepID=A0A0A0BDN3_9GAMM|nr:heme o synthase [Methylophaga thiooxydans]KGM06653.1 Heme O synthase, protoheme IX farnesyltransferase COX10-CtaB [Methylophaga thiooxydans]
MQTTLTSINTLRASWKDYLALCKPKVVLLMLITALVGAFIATPGWPNIGQLLIAVIGIGACAASGATINNMIDHQLDAKMARTRHRATASGIVSPVQALAFALALAVSGMLLLWFLVNPLTAWLTLFALIGYAVIYTLFLKRATPQNITIGGLAGAMPPLLGWTAVTGQVDPNALLLVLIIFAWTPPHFWALALHKKDEYAKADVPMLPVTHGDAFTRIQIALYSLLLLGCTLLPFVTGMSGLIYLSGILILNSRQFYLLWQLFDKKNTQAPYRLFKFSILYLLWLFLLILVDHAVFS